MPADLVKAKGMLVKLARRWEGTGAETYRLTVDRKRAVVEGSEVAQPIALSPIGPSEGLKDSACLESSHVFALKYRAKGGLVSAHLLLGKSHCESTQSWTCEVIGRG
jgi:hypothetical protein